MAKLKDSTIYGSLNVKNKITTDQLVVNGLDINSMNEFTFTAGENLVAGDLCYLKSSDSKMWKTDCDFEASSIGKLGIAQTTILANATGEFLTNGIWTTTGLTTGSIYYIGPTAGVWTSTIPSTSGQIVRIIGYALSTTILEFVPSSNYIQIG